MSQAERYIALQKLTEREHEKLDSSYHAAFYLLSSDEVISEIAQSHIDSVGIDFEELITDSKNKCLDDTMYQLLSIAYNLFSWTSETNVTPFDISRMEYPYMELVCNAIFIASGGCKVRIEINEQNQLELVLDTSRYERTKSIHEDLKRKVAEHLEKISCNDDLER